MESNDLPGSKKDSADSSNCSDEMEFEEDGSESDEPRLYIDESCVANEDALDGNNNVPPLINEEVKAAAGSPTLNCGLEAVAVVRKPLRDDVDDVIGKDNIERKPSEETVAVSRSSAFPEPDTASSIFLSLFDIQETSPGTDNSMDGEDEDVDIYDIEEPNAPVVYVTPASPLQLPESPKYSKAGHITAETVGSLTVSSQKEQLNSVNSSSSPKILEETPDAKANEPISQSSTSINILQSFELETITSQDIASQFNGFQDANSSTSQSVSAVSPDHLSVHNIFEDEPQAMDTSKEVKAPPSQAFESGESIYLAALNTSVNDHIPKTCTSQSRSNSDDINGDEMDDDLEDGEIMDDEEMSGSSTNIKKRKASDAEESVQKEKPVVQVESSSVCSELISSAKPLNGTVGEKKVNSKVIKAKRRRAIGDSSPRHKRRPSREATPPRHGTKKEVEKSNQNFNQERKMKSNIICQFFMEGKCRKSAKTCRFSHGAVDPKKMELCKFWARGCCAKKEKCPYMHDNFPCKYFHTGFCKAEERCKYSHSPLSDVLKQILIKHIETAPKSILGDFPRLSRQKAVKLMRQKEAKLKGIMPDDNNCISETHQNGYKNRGQMLPVQHDKHYNNGHRINDGRHGREQYQTNDKIRDQTFIEEAGFRTFYKDASVNGFSPQKPQIEGLSNPLSSMQPSSFHTNPHLIPQMLPGLLLQSNTNNSQALANVMVSLNFRNIAPTGTLPSSILSRLNSDNNLNDRKLIPTIQGSEGPHSSSDGKANKCNLTTNQRGLFMCQNNKQASSGNELQEQEENWYSSDDEEQSKLKYGKDTEMHNRISQLVNQIRRQIHIPSPASSIPTLSLPNMPSISSGTSIDKKPDFCNQPSSSLPKDAELRTPNSAINSNVGSQNPMNASLLRNSLVVPYRVIKVAGIPNFDYTSVVKGLSPAVISTDPRLNRPQNNSSKFSAS